MIVTMHCIVFTLWSQCQMLFVKGGCVCWCCLVFGVFVGVGVFRVGFRFSGRICVVILHGRVQSVTGAGMAGCSCGWRIGCSVPAACGYCLEASTSLRHGRIQQVLSVACARPVDSRLRGNDGAWWLVWLVHPLLPCQALGQALVLSRQGRGVDGWCCLVVCPTLWIPAYAGMNGLWLVLSCCRSTLWILP